MENQEQLQESPIVTALETVKRAIQEQTTFNAKEYAALQEIADRVNDLLNVL